MIVRQNFTILEIKKIVKAPGGFYLENIRRENIHRGILPEGPKIITYSYAGKIFKYFSVDTTWPPRFVKKPPIKSVYVDGEDYTKQALEFAGPYRCDFTPMSIVRITRRPRVRFKLFGILLTWEEYMSSSTHHSVSVAR